MKTISLIFTFIFLVVFQVNSQVLVSKEKVWSTFYTNCEGVPASACYIKFDGDTVINTKNYIKILESDNDEQFVWQTIGYIREENKRVLTYHDVSSKEILLYDFNMQVGDSILIEQIGYIEVDSIVTKTISDEERKCFYLSPTNEFGGQVIWVEGIGALAGVLHNSGNILLTGGNSSLLCYTENDVLIYSNPNYNTCSLKTILRADFELYKENQINIYPNPSKGVFFLELESYQSKNVEVSIITSTGKLIFKKECLYTEPFEVKSSIKKKGIYFLKVRIDNSFFVRKIAFN